MRGGLGAPPDSTIRVFGYAQFRRVEPVGWWHGQVSAVVVGWVGVGPMECSVCTYLATQSSLLSV